MRQQANTSTSAVKATETSGGKMPARSGRAVDFRSDQFWLGPILYEMATASGPSHARPARAYAQGA